MYMKIIVLSKARLIKIIAKIKLEIIIIINNLFVVINNIDNNILKSILVE